MPRKIELSPTVLAEFSTIAQSNTDSPSAFLTKYGAFLERVRSVQAKDKRAVHKSLKEAVSWYSRFMDLKYEAHRLGYKEKEKIIDAEVKFLENLVNSLQKKYEKSIWM